jgi:hypothetical protein
MGFLFMAEMAEKSDFPPEVGTPSNAYPSRGIYELFVGKYPESSYWLDWGGYYDYPVTKKAELYFGVFLINAVTIDNMLTQDTSYCIVGDTLYFNIPKHPWLYADTETEMRVTIGWLSGPPDPMNPCNTRIEGDLRPVRLAVPSISVKLSDPISGLTKYATFNFTLANDDGLYDESNVFNSPAYIYKTIQENPEYKDFTLIRYGLVENVKITSSSFTVECADMFRTLENPVCKVISIEDYPDAKEESLGKNIPVVYGTCEIDLIPLTDTTYLASEFIDSIQGVYDNDDESLSYSWDSETMIITASEDAKYAVITGYHNNSRQPQDKRIGNKIGQIIKDLTDRLSGIRYNETNWDTAETNAYIDNSPQVHYVIKSGKVRDGIKQILESDMAFLIQKSDHRFTLRRWGTVPGVNYPTHTIGSWVITKNPEKDYAQAQEQFFSSCVIAYNRNERTGSYGERLYANEKEDLVQRTYNKLKRETYETRLTNAQDARNLADLLSSRFCLLKETIRFAVGIDTGSWNLLDEVIIKLEVNGRQYSKHNRWIITEIDPAQDKLTLEAAAD